MSSCSAMTFFIIDVWTSFETLADAAAMEYCAMLLEIPSIESHLPSNGPPYVYRPPARVI